MLTYAERKTVFDLIPTSYSITGPQGTETFGSISKRYANQFVLETPLPAIVVNFPEESVEIFEPLLQKRRTRTVSVDTFTKSVGVDKYVLTISSADEIKKVVGTVGGTPKTTIPSTDYQLLTSTNEIELLGPTRPDDTTDFTVEYNHQIFRRFKGQELADLLTVNVYADDKHEQNNKTFPGIVVAEQIAERLRQYFLWEFNENGLLAVRFSSIRDLDFLLEETQYRRRRQFDFQVRHLAELEEQVETIETVDRTVIVQVDP